MSPTIPVRELLVARFASDRTRRPKRADMVLALRSNHAVPASISNALARYCEPTSTVAVCVSGGVDSMSLLYASRAQQTTEAALREIASAKDLATQAASAPLVITVDHQLRKESSWEAAFVRDSAERAGLKGITLKLDWQGEHTPTNKIMEEARNRRYRAIADACLGNGVDCLMTAHHHGDQLETLLMRMRFGSGLLGLAAMRPMTSMSHLLNSHEPALQQLKVVRPFLNLTREELQLYLEEAGIEWVEDPTNQDTTYMRTRMRNMLREDTTGFREQVGRLLKLCCQWRGRVEAEAVQLAHSAAVPASPVVYWILKYLEDGAATVEFPCTRLELHIPTLQAASKHTQVALVAAALQTVHNRNHAPNSPDVDRTLKYAFSGETVKRTFHKCYLSRKKGSSTLVMEAQR